jgi:biotin transport system substrate-specific component
MKKNLVYSALILSGLIATGGLSLNIGPVPLTFQVFFVIFAGLFLPKNYSFVPAAMYLIMGGLGLPVFAGFSSGFEHFISPTGGYLISFPIASFLISLLVT